MKLHFICSIRDVIIVQHNLINSIMGRVEILITVEKKKQYHIIVVEEKKTHHVIVLVT